MGLGISAFKMSTTMVAMKKQAVGGSYKWVSFNNV